LALGQHLQSGWHANSRAGREKGETEARGLARHTKEALKLAYQQQQYKWREGEENMFSSVTNQ